MTERSQKSFPEIDTEDFKKSIFHSQQKYLTAANPAAGISMEGSSTYQALVLPDIYWDVSRYPLPSKEE
jgi:hypothetical protein